MCGVRAAVFVAEEVGAGLGGGAVLQRWVPAAGEGRGEAGHAELSTGPLMEIAWSGAPFGAENHESGDTSELEIPHGRLRMGEVLQLLSVAQ